MVQAFDRKFPISHEVTLSHGAKPVSTTKGLTSHPCLHAVCISFKVSALGLDPSGARLITGGYDYEVRQIRLFCCCHDSGNRAAATFK